MKNLASILCLTIAVLLGSAGVNYVSSAENRDARSIWKGTEWEKRIDGWVYKIKFNDSGDQYSVKISGREEVNPCSGRVDQDGTLSQSRCKYTQDYVRLEIEGNVSALNLSVAYAPQLDPIFEDGLSSLIIFDELERKLATLKNKGRNKAEFAQRAEEERKAAQAEVARNKAQEELKILKSQLEKLRQGEKRKANQAQVAGMNYVSSRDLTQETQGLPYWAGHEKKILGENGHFSIEIKYSKDGKSYTADINIINQQDNQIGYESTTGTGFNYLFIPYKNCAGGVEKNGDLEQRDCTLNWQGSFTIHEGTPRIFRGHVTKIIYENLQEVGSIPTETFIDKELGILKTQFETFQQEENKRVEFARKAEVERLAELNRKQDEEKRQAGLARKADDAKRLAELKRKKAEEKRQAELARKAADAKRLAEINRKVAELDRKTAEAKRLAELKRKQTEEKRQADLARKAAEAKQLTALKQKQAEEKQEAKVSLLAKLKKENLEKIQVEKTRNKILYNELLPTARTEFDDAKKYLTFNQDIPNLVDVVIAAKGLQGALKGKDGKLLNQNLQNIRLVLSNDLAFKEFQHKQNQIRQNKEKQEMAKLIKELKVYKKSLAKMVVSDLINSIQNPEKPSEILNLVDKGLNSKKYMLTKQYYDESVALISKSPKTKTILSRDLDKIKAEEELKLQVALKNKEKLIKEKEEVERKILEKQNKDIKDKQFSEKRQASIENERKKYTGKLLIKIYEKEDILESNVEKNKNNEIISVDTKVGCKYHFYVSNFTNKNINLRQFKLAVDMRDTALQGPGYKLIGLNTTVGEDKSKNIGATPLSFWLTKDIKVPTDVPGMDRIKVKYGCNKQSNKLSIVYSKPGNFIQINGKKRTSKKTVARLVRAADDEGRTIKILKK